MNETILTSPFAEATQPSAPNALPAVQREPRPAAASEHSAAWRCQQEPWWQRLLPAKRRKRSTPRRYDFAALRHAARQHQPATAVESLNREPWLQLGIPSHLHFKHASLPIHDLSESLHGLRLLHLSDLHLRRHWSKGYDRLIERLEDAAVDLILITGDFIENKVDVRPALPVLRRLLPRLKARLGIYGILGNHDPDALRGYLAECGVCHITGKHITLESESGSLELIGLAGNGRNDFNFHQARSIPARRPGRPRIVLSHYPDLFPRAQMFDPDLFLAGHTHGGQVCLPGGIAPLTHDALPRKLSKGIHRIGRTWFSVSCGAGNSGFLIRLFCPAEATFITLTKSNDAR